MEGILSLNNKDSVTIILPVHNQAELLVAVCHGIISNMSENVKEIIIIIDGCTDNSEAVLNSILGYFPFPPIILHEPNVFEVRCTNIGFKLSTCEYSLAIQDDMVVTEKDFDKRMLKPFKYVPDVLAVTARDAVDVVPLGDGLHLNFINVAGRDVNTPRNIFAVRDAINRGYILFDNEKVRKLNYMDEIYMPQNLDEVDIGIRGYLQHGWLVGAYVTGYQSEPQWGISRKDKTSNRIFYESNEKNHKILLDKYIDFLQAEKHDQNIIIE